MQTEEIQKFLNNKAQAEKSYVKIDFKTRDSIYGLFIFDKDYNELKSKNFWRIITRTHFDAFGKSGDVNLARIFNGAEFSKLSLLTDGF
jgi:hypothetical protein